MKKFLNKLTREPNLVTGALTATFNMLVLLSIIEMDATAIAGINVAVGAWFILIRQFVVPEAEAVAVQKMGEPVKATARAQKRWGIKKGTTVHVEPAFQMDGNLPKTA